MCKVFLSITMGFVFAGACLATSRGNIIAWHPKRVVKAAPRVDFLDPPANLRVYEGRIKDIRPVWGILILTVGKGKKARDLRFDMSEARIVGPSGAEWKGEDVWVGDRVRVELTRDLSLVKQITVLPFRSNIFGRQNP